MTTDVKKSVLRNFENFLRKDVMDVVKGMSVDPQIPKQTNPATVAASRPSVNASSVRPAPVKGKLLYFPSKKRTGV